ncbi:MAG: MATE family efflux transporter [Natrialbaceae archaeon]|nr:MATE family efflux transporter [Natrialbaceae archaeon]
MPGILGAQGTDRAGRAAGQTVVLVAVISAVLAGIGVRYTRPLLEIIPSDQATAASVIPLAANYLEIVFVGLPFMFAFFLFAALMRGHGDTRTPMLVMVASVLANVIIDPLLIFGFDGNPLLGVSAGIELALFSLTGFAGWGVEGAAIATVLSRGLAGAIGLWVMSGTAHGPAISLGDFWPDREMLEELIRLGIPATLEQSTSSLAMVTITVLVLTFRHPSSRRLALATD